MTGEVAVWWGCWGEGEREREEGGAGVGIAPQSSDREGI